MKTKKEAADYLGISTRQLENYAKQGKLSVQYQRGRTGDVATFDDAELRKLKAEIDSRHMPRPSVVTDAPESHAMVRDLASDASRLPALQNLLGALLSSKATPVPSISDLAAKPLLTIAEAQRLAGLSRQTLLEAHHAGNLKLITIGRGYRVKRNDLDQFIKKL